MTQIPNSPSHDTASQNFATSNVPTPDAQTPDTQTLNSQLPATLSIRQMCEVFDVTARTLRFYESKELLFPVREGTKRHFTRADRARLTLILRGKRFGFSLEDIRQLLSMYDREGSNAAQLTRTLEVGQGRLVQMLAQRAELDQAITDQQNQLAEGTKMLSALANTATT